MKRPSGTAAVRLSLWMLLSAALAMSLVQPALAGTEDAPEIQDPADDQTLLGTAPVEDQAGGNSDILAGWVTETATELHLFINSQGDFTDGTAGPYVFSFHFTLAGTEYIASVTTGDPPTAGGVATAATLDGNTVDLTVPKADVGSPAAGAAMTGLFIESAGGSPPEIPQGLFGDRAPDEGNGADYTVTGGASGPAPNPNDTDADGMNDTCEQQYFGNVTAQNATGDPDADGLTNGQECALGTDPTKADSDGDGTNDKEDSAPMDPAKGGTTTTSSSSSTSRSSTSTTSGSRSTSSSGDGGDGSDGACADDDAGDAVDCLEADLGYVGLSAGGFLAVLVLCILALAVRWSL